MRICRYRTLVSSEQVPAWDFRSIKGGGYRRHLYTSTITGIDSDALEKWFNRVVEDPALPAIGKILNGQSLTPEDRRVLTLFTMALEVRTPLSYVQWRERTISQAEGLLQNTLAKVPQLLKAAARNGAPRAVSTDREPKIPLRVKKEVDKDGYITRLGAELIVGREMWFWSIRHTLTETIRTVPRPSWMVLRPAKDQEWFTSDQPVLRLGYNSPDNFDFGGGWGRRGCEVLLPISPQHLLYCKVGNKGGGEVQLGRAQTYEMQRMLALRAWREILARQPVSRVERFRPRVINRDLFRHEEAMWERFHEEQSKGHVLPDSDQDR